MNIKSIHKAVDAGKSLDVIVGMFANKRTTNTDEIRKVVSDYHWETWRKTGKKLWRKTGKKGAY